MRYKDFDKNNLGSPFEVLMKYYNSTFEDKRKMSYLSHPCITKDGAYIIIDMLVTGVNEEELIMILFPMEYNGGISTYIDDDNEEIIETRDYVIYYDEGADKQLELDYQSETLHAQDMSFFDFAVSLDLLGYYDISIDQEGGFMEIDKDCKMFKQMPRFTKLP